MFKIDRFVNAAYGNNCLFCSNQVEAAGATASINKVCSDCIELLPWHLQACPQCGLGNTTVTCGQCLKSEPYFDTTVASLAYNYPIDSVLQRFKYQQQLPLAPVLANLLMQQTPDLSMADYIMPMPMHAKRLQERGFNQSLEIAKIVGKTLNISVKPNISQRILHTAPQASLALKERAKNIKGAFQTKEDLTGQHIIVIDDVMTSGASLNELAKTLKKAGASTVNNWVIARTLS